MAGWLSRTLTRFAEQPAPRSIEPRPEAEVRKAVEAAKRTMTDGDFAAAADALYPVVQSNPNDADAVAYYGAAAYFAGDAEAACNACSRAVQIDPNHVAGHKYLAAAYLALGNLQEFDKTARVALRLNPRDRELLNMYGIACMNRYDVPEAAKSFNAAVEVSPSDIGALVNLENLSIRSLKHRRTLEQSPKVGAARTQAINRLRAQFRRGQLDDEGLRNLLLLLAGGQETYPAAVELARTVAKRAEFSTYLADQLAGIFMAIGDLKEGLRFRRMIVDQDSKLPLARRSLAFSELLASYDRWLENWETMRVQECDANLGIFASEVPSWTGQRLGKKKLLVYQEQGIGDAILALRLIPMLAKRGVRFDLWVVPALASLAAGVKGYENLIRSEQRPDARTLGCDYASTLFGLIPALGASHEELIKNPTVLVPAPERMPNARARLRQLPGKRIGLAYGGNPDRRDDWYRSIPPAALRPLVALDGVSWVNLSIDPRPDKVEVAEMFRMDDPMKEAKDFEDSAAIVSELDAVIAVDSSVAHLSASLGKPVWVLVPTMPDWRWQIGSDTKPWWLNTTVLRSPEMGQWGSVIEELAKLVELWRA
jgi:tetratricopeptide (TPR) repeat protein